jgi:death-on-curing protein
LLESAPFRPRTGYYRDLVEMAAALFESLLMNHPFVDGNKRVGAHACVLFLLVNDVEPSFSSAELAGITLAVARGEVSAEALAIWLRQRTRHR